MTDEPDRVAAMARDYFQKLGSVDSKVIPGSPPFFVEVGDTGERVQCELRVEMAVSRWLSTLHRVRIRTLRITK